MNNKMVRWDEFCKKYNVQEGVFLFELENKFVKVETRGRKERKILQLSSEMKCLVIKEAKKVISDSEHKYDGLIYIMYWKNDSQVIPLYIGKCRKFGRGKNLNKNIENISKNERYFCRWGYDYYRHIGGLSAATLCGYPQKTHKYEKWAEKLFKNSRTNTLKLRKPTYFWISACDEDLRKYLCATSLSSLESSLIDIARETFPKTLLNFR